VQAHEVQPSGAGVPSGKGKLKRLPLDSEELAGRDARRAPGHALGLDEREPGEREKRAPEGGDLIGGRPLRVRFRERADELGLAEGRPPRRQPLRPEEALHKSRQARPGPLARAAEEGAELNPPQPVLGSPGPPFGAQPLERELLLALPGRERSHTSGSKPIGAPRLQVLEQRPPSGRERAHSLLGDAHDLRHPLLGLRPREPEPAGELEA
jgi:hypothetical protein